MKKTQKQQDRNDALKALACTTLIVAGTLALVTFAPVVFWQWVGTVAVVAAVVGLIAGTAYLGSPK